MRRSNKRHPKYCVLIKYKIEGYRKLHTMGFHNKKDAQKFIKTVMYQDGVETLQLGKMEKPHFGVRA